MNEDYLRIVTLLIDSAPLVFQSEGFALKGGTAINLFVQDMPRLSVDLDLVCLDTTTERSELLKIITTETEAMKKRLEKVGLDVNFSGEANSKLQIIRDTARVKVEINYVMRGTFYPIQELQLSKSVRDKFKKSFELPILDVEELYASKLVAAFDRQHPRDLFDVTKMLEIVTITPRMLDAFVGYLVSHPRPIHEVLFKRYKDIEDEYENHFKGMADEDLPLEALLTTRQTMFDTIHSQLTQSHKDFLNSFNRMEPDWGLLGLPLEQMPAIRWQLLNLQKFKTEQPKKFDQQITALETRLASLSNPNSIQKSKV